MVILLKALAFTIWMGIMIAVIAASRYKMASDYHEANVYIGDEDDIEMTIWKILRHLKPQDRLIIYNIAKDNELLHQVLIKSLIRKNPSVVYYNLGRNFV